MIRTLPLLAVLLSTTAAAEAPKVVTDIAPVQSMVARVMGDLGEPKSLIEAGVSPHDYAMRPSEAAALEAADLVVWIGSALTPQLDGSIDSLAKGATVLSLMEVPDINLLDYRELNEFGGDHHGDEHHGDEHGDEHHGDEHGEDHHGDEHADDHHGEDHHGDEHVDDHHGDEHHGDEHAEDAHSEEKHADKGHDDHGHHDHHHHGEQDPHLWLDPMNAIAAMQAVAELLAEKDPANAATYRENARAGAEELKALNKDLTARLAGIGEGRFIVYHDAFHYFEARYGISAAGAIAVGDASSPGPARLKQVREILVDSGAECVFAEPQHPEQLTTVVTEGTDVRAGVLDPHGANLKPGAGLYPALLTQMADNITSCLNPQS